jgi:uncharacterized membrane protein YgdD (TMEM256/DUF423 family)
MVRSMTSWGALAALFLAAAVGLGAFGAHALRGRLDAYATGIWEKAVFYHFIHALGVLMVSLLPRLGALDARPAGWVCGLLASGIVLFSGSLYLLAITGVRLLGAVTPVGGVAFIAGWVLLAWKLAAAPGQP